MAVSALAVAILALDVGATHAAGGQRREASISDLVSAAIRHFSHTTSHHRHGTYRSYFGAFHFTYSMELFIYFSRQHC